MRSVWRLSVGLLVVLSLVLVLLSPPAANASPTAETHLNASFPQSNLWYTITPSVVWCGDPKDTVRIEIHIVGRNDVDSISVPHWTGTTIQLYDDGTHGDTAAGDNVFTAASAILPCNPDTSMRYGGYRGLIGAWWGTPSIRLKNGTTQSYDYGIQAGTVHPRFKNRFAVRDFGGGLLATNYAFFIVDAKHEVLDGYPLADVRCGKGNYAAYQKLYSVFADVFDFAYLTPGMPIFHRDNFGEQTPYQVQVRNDVQHIGLPIVNNTATFGSAGRLKSAIFHSFGSVTIFPHEIAHTWGAGIGSSLGLIHEGLAGRYHWHEMTDIAGQLGWYYFTPSGPVGHFVHNGDLTWRLQLNTDKEAYAPLELYVMGLIPPEQVPPIHILTNPNLDDLNRITAQSVTTVTIQQIMQAEGGPRNPPSSQSPKKFNLAFIVTQDHPYNDAAYAYFSLMSVALGTLDSADGLSLYEPFYWATGGRATINTRLPLNLADPYRRVIYVPLGFSAY